MEPIVIHPPDEKGYWEQHINPQNVLTITWKKELKSELQASEENATGASPASERPDRDGQEL